MEKKQCCWVLTGPTASGKTGLSIRLAKAYGCEIICMDSMQLYRGMDIGTAKPTMEEMDGIPHHMLDVADPRESFSVARYQEMAEAVCREIFARGRQPLFVGGTGLYLRALRHPMAMGEVCGDEAIRDELQAIADSPDGKQRLHAMLAAVDADTAARLHLNDVRRVIRALEVYRLTGTPFSRQPQSEAEPSFAYRVASLTMERAALYRRIELRVDQMLAMGLVDEVRRLLDSGVPETAQALKGLGYKELIPYLQGACSLEEAVYQLKLGTRHYAKRQLTWMRREEDVLWVDSLAPDAYAQLQAWYTEGENA
ncbi:MAG: tRNA (adenosine(37)-N6)-dimethylallyltransferase MiaA [Aristaeellaceae bacterium]